MHNNDLSKDLSGLLPSLIMFISTHLSSFAYLGNSEGGTPVVFENVKTYDSLGVHVTVVNSCSEGHFWWLEGVLGGEMDVKKEDSTLIGGTRGS